MTRHTHMDCRCGAMGVWCAQAGRYRWTREEG